MSDGLRFGVCGCGGINVIVPDESVYGGETSHCLKCTAAERKHLEAENAKLREALAWYADRENWRTPMQVGMDFGGDPPTSNVCADEGERARAALEMGKVGK
jgi:hypothetical protein